MAHIRDSRESRPVTTFILPTNVRDATTGSSSKSWTVPAGECWKLHWAHVILTTDATAGNRFLRLEVLDNSGNLRMTSRAGVSQAASIADQVYEFSQGVNRETTVTATSAQVSLPIDLFIEAGWQLRIRDTSAISPTGDTMVVSFQYTDYIIT